MSQNTIQLPEPYTRRELNALYGKIPLTEEESKLLRKYCLAMAHLYGMVPMKKVWEIVMKQNPNQFTRKQLHAFANVARHETDLFMILGDEEVYHDGPRSTPTNRTLYDCDILYGNVEDFQMIRGCQQGKPYYIPEKKVLLRYYDERYCQPTPASKAMKACLAKLIPDDARKAKSVFEHLLYIARTATHTTDVITRILEYEKLQWTLAQTQKLFEHYNVFHNNTRMPSNLGHTPNEISDMIPLEQRMPKSMSFGPGIQQSLRDGTLDPAELFQGILTMDCPNEELRCSMLQEIQKVVPTVTQPKSTPKVGRNDPCPCGSGKKYKRCCGK